VDVAPKTPLEPGRVLGATQGCDAVALYADDAGGELSAELERAGLGFAGRFADGPSRAVAVFVREAKPQNGQ
jgi:hypothetical protein